MLQASASIVCCSFFLVKWWAIEWTWWQLEKNQRSEIHMQLRVTPTPVLWRLKLLHASWNDVRRVSPPKWWPRFASALRTLRDALRESPVSRALFLHPMHSLSYVKHIEALIKSDQNIKTKHCHAKRCQQKRCSVASLRTISSLTKHFQIPVRFSQKSFQPNLSTVVRWTAVTTVTAMATRKAKELAPAGAYSYSETNLDAKMWNLVNIWHGAGSRDTVKGCSTPLPGWSRKGGIECCSYIVLWSLRRKLSICS